MRPRCARYAAAMPVYARAGVCLVVPLCSEGQLKLQGLILTIAEPAMQGSFSLHNALHVLHVEHGLRREEEGDFERYRR